MQTGQQEGGVWLLLLGGLITVVLGTIYGDSKAVAVGVVCSLLGGGILFAFSRR